MLKASTVDGRNAQDVTWSQDLLGPATEVGLRKNSAKHLGSIRISSEEPSRALMIFLFLHCRFSTKDFLQLDQCYSFLPPPREGLTQYRNGAALSNCCPRMTAEYCGKHPDIVVIIVGSPDCCFDHCVVRTCSRSQGILIAIA